MPEAQLIDLELLTLNNTAVSDAGLLQLGPLGKLDSLFLYDTHATDQGVGMLKKKLPNLTNVHLHLTGDVPVLKQSRCGAAPFTALPAA